MSGRYPPVCHCRARHGNPILTGQAFRTSAIAPFLHSVASLLHFGTPSAVLQSLTQVFTPRPTVTSWQVKFTIKTRPLCHQQKSIRSIQVFFTAVIFTRQIKSSIVSPYTLGMRTLQTVIAGNVNFQPANVLFEFFKNAELFISFKVFSISHKRAKII